MNYDRLWKALTYLLCLLILTILQMSVLPWVSLLGAHPNLFPSFVAIVSVLEGGFSGAALGFAAGLCADVLAPSQNVFFAVAFLLSGAAIGKLSAYVFQKNLLTTMVWAALCHTVTNAVYFFLFFLLPGRAGFLSFGQVHFPEVLFSLILMPPLYLLLHSNHKHWTEEEEEQLTIDN